MVSTHTTVDDLIDLPDSPTAEEIIDWLRARWELYHSDQRKSETLGEDVQIADAAIKKLGLDPRIERIALIATGHIDVSLTEYEYGRGEDGFDILEAALL